ncbi:ribonucleases P/MRP protein subunit RPP40 [Alternaria panax]|uniref:Ribonucleases P/MRP protein subunit RPP40 n=1 Tax=Alternaria panax TaxID=48097 RepID=A0AAD4I7H9_9PLEO|nr:ribonucleases P/MRP protein subunit RPP40 [Alternaria panax]
MLDIHRADSAPDTKIYFSHSILPSYIDPQNVSTKRKPFSAFNKQKYSHTVDLVLPEEMYQLVKNELGRFDGPARAQYARVHMKLGEILESEFLNTYIKQGNIMMLSEGRPLIDNRFELYEGTLRMELTRPTYERCGLQGTPIEDGGKKHQKQRWVVEYDLRASSMKHGKKGFSRLEWACNNVLDRSLTWLFYNFNPSSAESLDEGKEPISKHAPCLHSITPEEVRMDIVLVPQLPFNDLKSIYDEEEALDLLEYLHMLQLKSPRVEKGNNLNPHLARYEVPDLGKGVATKNMVTVQWRGFISPAFVRDLFLMIRKESSKGSKKANGTQDTDMDMEGNSVVKEGEDEWFSMSAQAFGGKNAWTAMQFAGRETLVWEMEK